MNSGERNMAQGRSEGPHYGSVGSINQENIGRPISAARTQLTPFGRIRRYHDIPVQEKCFLYLSLISGTISIGLTVYNLVVLENNSPDWVLAWVVLVTSVFSLRYATFAIFFQQWLEMVNFCLSRLINVVHVTVYVFLAPERRGNAADGAVSDQEFWGVITFGLVLIVLFVWGLYLTVVYRLSNDLAFSSTASADPLLQSGANRLHVIQAMLVLNIQLEISVILLAAEKGFRLWNAMDVAAIACGPIFIVTTRMIAHMALKCEKHLLVYLYVLLSVLEVAMIGSEFRAIAYSDITSFMRIAVILTGSFGMILQLLIDLLIYMYARVYFGKGLNRLLFDVQSDSPQQEISADDHRL